MQPQYSQGAAPSHHPPPYAPPEVSQASGGSITSSLRQWRKKDYVEKQQSTEQPSTSISENLSHVARVAPHTYYPRLSNDVCHYQHQYAEYGVPYKPQAPAPVKYSEIVDNPQPQPIEHIASAIPKHKDKDYGDLCSVPPQPHLKQYQDQMPLKQPYPDGAKQTYVEPTVHHQYISKESQINPFIQKQPQMHQYIQKEPYQQFIPKYSMQSQYPQPYASEPNNFLAHLNKINPRMAQSIMNDTHLRDPQIPMYHTLDQSRTYPQPQRMYHTQSVHSSPTHGHRNISQPYNYPQPYNYNVKSGMQPNDPYNRIHQYQHNVPKYLSEYKMNAPMEQPIPNISPQRVYNESMHMNYAPMPPKISPNYPHCSQLEYAQHYQHRRAQINQEYYPHSAYKSAYVQNPQVSPEGGGSDTRTRKSSLKQYLETWVEEDMSGNLPDIVVSNNLNDVENIETIKDTTEIPNENLPHFLHLQQFEKLPDNIRGYYHSANAIPPGSRRIIIENSNVECSESGQIIRGNPASLVSKIPEVYTENGNIVTIENENIMEGQRKIITTDGNPEKIGRVIENQIQNLENKVVQIHIIEDTGAATASSTILSSDIPASLNNHQRNSSAGMNDTVIIQSNLYQQNVSHPEHFTKIIAEDENCVIRKRISQDEVETQTTVTHAEMKNMPVIDETPEENLVQPEVSANSENKVVEEQTEVNSENLSSRRSSICSIYREMEHIHRESFNSNSNIESNKPEKPEDNNIPCNLSASQNSLEKDCKGSNSDGIIDSGSNNDSDKTEVKQLCNKVENSKESNTKDKHSNGISCETSIISNPELTNNNLNESTTNLTTLTNNSETPSDISKDESELSKTDNNIETVKENALSNELEKENITVGNVNDEEEKCAEESLNPTTVSNTEVDTAKESSNIQHENDEKDTSGDKVNKKEENISDDNNSKSKVETENSLRLSSDLQNINDKQIQVKDECISSNNRRIEDPLEKEFSKEISRNEIEKCDKTPNSSSQNNCDFNSASTVNVIEQDDEMKIQSNVQEKVENSESIEIETELTKQTNIDIEDTEPTIECFKTEKNHAVFLNDAKPENFLEEINTESYMQSSRPLNLSKDKSVEESIEILTLGDSPIAEIPKDTQQHNEDESVTSDTSETNLVVVNKESNCVVKDITVSVSLPSENKINEEVIETNNEITLEKVTDSQIDHTGENINKPDLNIENDKHISTPINAIDEMSRTTSNTVEDETSKSIEKRLENIFEAAEATSDLHDNATNSVVNLENVIENKEITEVAETLTEGISGNENEKLIEELSETKTNLNDIKNINSEQVIENFQNESSSMELKQSGELSDSMENIPDISSMESNVERTEEENSEATMPVLECMISNDKELKVSNQSKDSICIPKSNTRFDDYSESKQKLNRISSRKRNKTRSLQTESEGSTTDIRRKSRRLNKTKDEESKEAKVSIDVTEPEVVACNLPEKVVLPTMESEATEDTNSRVNEIEQTDKKEQIEELPENCNFTEKSSETTNDLSKIGEKEDNTNNSSVISNENAMGLLENNQEENADAPGIVYQINDSNVVLQIADELLEINVVAQNGRKIILVKTFSDAIIINNSDEDNLQAYDDVNQNAVQYTEDADLKNEALLINNFENNEINEETENFCLKDADITVGDDVCIYNEEVVSSSTEIETVPKIINDTEETVETVESEDKKDLQKKYATRKSSKKDRKVSWEDEQTNKTKCLTDETQQSPQKDNTTAKSKSGSNLSDDNKKSTIKDSLRKSPKTKAALKFVEAAKGNESKVPLKASEGLNPDQKNETDVVSIDKKSSSKPLKKRQTANLSEEHEDKIKNVSKQKNNNHDNNKSKTNENQTKIDEPQKIKEKTHTKKEPEKTKETASNAQIKHNKDEEKNHKSSKAKKSKHEEHEKSKTHDQKPKSKVEETKVKKEKETNSVKNRKDLETKKLKSKLPDEQKKSNSSTQSKNKEPAAQEKQISVQENSITSSTSQENEASSKERNSKLIQQITDDWDEEPEDLKTTVENSCKRRLSLQEYNSRKRTNSVVEQETVQTDLTNSAWTESNIATINKINRELSPESPALNVNFNNKTYSRSSNIFSISKTSAIISNHLNCELDVSNKESSSSSSGGSSSNSNNNSSSSNYKNEECLSSAIELHLPKINRSPKPTYNQEYLRNALVNDLQTVNAYTTTLIKENQQLMQRFLEQKRLTSEELKKVKTIIRYKRLVQHLSTIKINEMQNLRENYQENLKVTSNLSLDTNQRQSSINRIVSVTEKPRLDDKLTLPLKKIEDIPEKRRRKRFRFLYSDEESEQHHNDLPAQCSDSIITNVNSNCCLNKRPRLDLSVPTLENKVMDYSVHQSNSQGQLTLVFKRSFKSDPKMQPFVKLERLPSIDLLAKNRLH
ncbi:hypothetical protein ILUMI_25619 [Ignelater luminosus]|uniref:Uncharacterized protein n=1 Tax=Ignelater luminosus TaxID=2038154 RepID=A0A8K0C9L4_IGNLU|nr:hypothetical protein ILUMI_25619 [Ignelater luminosus]